MADNLMKENETDEYKVKIFEFIAFPGHCWLAMCAWVMGWEFKCGPDIDDESSTD